MKKGGVSLLFHFYKNLVLLHDELLSGRSGLDEIDTRSVTTEVEGVDANVTFKAIDVLTHQVEDGHIFILA